ncbi:hypothetical protein O181_075404, partial [Austropuccinia psidii MF-1]|nr:hypothetical protein [Austropuccinia psidii MF-1]
MTRGVPSQDACVGTPLSLKMMKSFWSGNRCPYPKKADSNVSRQLDWFHMLLICPPGLLGHHPSFNSLLDHREVIIRPMKDGNGKRRFKLGPITTMSCNPRDSNAKESPVPSMPCKQTLPQPAPGPSVTQSLEELFYEPLQPDEPPIPGPSQSSKPHKDSPT